MKTHFIVVTLSSIFVQFILQCDGQHWSTGVFDHVKSVGNQFYNTVTTNLDEAKNVAEILAGDAKDAIETVATASIDDYIPDLGGDELQNVQENTLPNNFQNYRQTSPPVNQGVIPSMLRMVGLDEQKLGMMALNMLVYLAEYIAKNFLGMESEFQNEVPQYRSIVQEEGVLAAMFKVVQDANVKSEKIRNDLFDPKITENMIEKIPQNFMGQELSCVQLFMCKMEPAIWSAQTTTKSYEGFTLTRSTTQNFNKWLHEVYQNLPNLNKLQTFGKRCHNKYPNCELLSLI